MASGSSSVREKSHSSVQRPGTGSGSAFVAEALAAAMAPAGNEAIRAASSSTCACSSLEGSARLTHPQRSAVACVDVPAPEHHLEGAGPPDERGQPLRAATAGDDAEGDFGLAEDGSVDVGESHVHGRHELAATTADSPLDHGDRGFRHRSEAVDHRVEEPEFVVRLTPGLAREPQDQVDVGVGDEELVVGGRQHQHPCVVVVLDCVPEPVELEHQREIEQVDRRMVDDSPHHAAGRAHPHRFEVVVRHGGKLEPMDIGDIDPDPIAQIRTVAGRCARIPSGADRDGAGHGG